MSLPGIKASIGGLAGGRGPLGDITSGGTNIGNLTVNGGLAALFNNVNPATTANSACLGTTTSAWGGKTFAAPTIVEQITVYGSSDNGMVFGAGATNVTVSLYGKNGAAPVNGTDGGTLLGTAGPTADANNLAMNIVSSDQNTPWAHSWVNIVHNIAATTICVAELDMSGWVA